MRAPSTFEATHRCLYLPSTMKLLLVLWSNNTNSLPPIWSIESPYIQSGTVDLPSITTLEICELHYSYFSHLSFTSIYSYCYHNTHIFLCLSLVSLQIQIWRCDRGVKNDFVVGCLASDASCPVQLNLASHLPLPLFEEFLLSSSNLCLPLNDFLYDSLILPVLSS